MFLFCSITFLVASLECPIIKTEIIGEERTSKLNELIRINEEIMKIFPELAVLGRKVQSIRIEKDLMNPLLFL